MTWIGQFESRIRFQDPDSTYPLLFVTLSCGSHSINAPACLDTGASATLIDSDVLAPIGWTRLPEVRGQAKLFTGASGAPVWASPLDVTLGLESGEEFEMTVYGSHQMLSRNLLGQDFLLKVGVGLDTTSACVYLSSIARVSPIFVAR